MNIAEAIVKTLIAEKVETVFGLPGSQLIPIYGALIKNNSRISHILLRHEQAVGFAGMGYALTTNKPGILMVMPGPGITNLISAITEAFYQSVPLLIITADHPKQNLGKEAFHELDSFTMLKPVTKLILNPQRPGDVIPALQKGLAYSQHGKPGPVYLNIPANLLQEESPAVNSKFKIQNSKLNKEEIKKAVEVLQRSQSPIIFAGSGVLRAGATRELQTLAEELQIPVMTTLGGKGIIPENHPLAIGTPSFDISFEFLEEADLALVIGARLNPVNTKMETLQLPKIIIRVDTNPEKKSKYKPALNIKSDCREFLTELLNEVRKKKIAPQKNRIMEIFKSALSNYKNYYGKNFDSERRLITPPELFEELSEVLENEDFIFLTDSVWIPSTYLLPKILKPYSFACIRSFGCLGFALPAAIGAAIANPNKKIISLSGDGAFLFNCQEVASSVDYNLKNLYQIIMINDGYGSIKHLEQNMLDGKSTAVSWKPVDFAKIAEGFGAKGFLINEKGKLEQTLKEVLKEDGPSVISVNVENIPTMRKEVMKTLLKKAI